MALNGFKSLCEIFSQRSQSDELKISDNDSMSTLVTGCDLFWDFSKTEDKNLMPSLKEHPGSDSLRDDCKSPGNYTLGAFG